jgi:hypothetical protein
MLSRRQIFATALVTIARCANSDAADSPIELPPLVGVLNKLSVYRLQYGGFETPEVKLISLGQLLDKLPLMTLRPPKTLGEKLLRSNYDDVYWAVAALKLVSVEQGMSAVFLREEAPIRFVSNSANTPVVLIGLLVSGTLFNTLRMDTSQRAASAFRMFILPAIQTLGSKISAAPIAFGIAVMYGSKTFTDDDSMRPELLTAVISGTVARQYAAAEITVEKLISNSQFYGFDRNNTTGNVARLEMTLR